MGDTQVIYSVNNLKTAQRCKKLWHYNYIRKLEPVGSESFEAAYGHAFHERLEGLPSEHFGAKWNRIIDEHVHAYNSYWSAEDIEVVAREVPFEFSLTCDENYRVHGYIDAVLKLPSGEYIISDTKTTGKPAADVVKYHEHGLQLPMYVLATQHDPELAKYNISRAMIDITTRPRIKQRKTEADDDYVQRVADWLFDNQDTSFYREQFHYDSGYLHDVASEAMHLIDELEQGYYVKNRDSCYKFNEQCGFFKSCFLAEPLSNTELYQVRKSKRSK